MKKLQNCQTTIMILGWLSCTTTSFLRHELIQMLERVPHTNKSLYRYTAIPLVLSMSTIDAYPYPHSIDIYTSKYVCMYLKHTAHSTHMYFVHIDIGIAPRSIKLLDFVFFHGTNTKTLVFIDDFGSL